MAGSSTGYVIGVPLPPAPAGVVFRHTREAVRQAGELQLQAWLKLADGEVVNRLTGDYIAGLREADSFQHPYDKDDLAVGVFNLAKHAAPIEFGTRAFNLASAIRWGQTPKAKLGKHGWYLRIPFRHYTPPRAGEGATPGREKASMPRAVYNLARHLDPGERLTGRRGRIVTETGRVPGGVRGIGPGFGRYLASTRSPVAATIGTPGAKSAASFAAALAGARESGAAPPSPFHVSGKFEGMFRSGAKGHSQYITVRTITPESQWWIPARPGSFVARRVAEQTDPIVRAMIEDAFRRDVEDAIGQALGGTG